MKKLVESKYPVSIGFWNNKSGTGAMTHAKGLTQEHIDFLRSLKVGDRLVVWNNEGKSENAPHLNLKKATDVKKSLV